MTLGKNRLWSILFLTVILSLFLRACGDNCDSGACFTGCQTLCARLAAQQPESNRCMGVTGATPGTQPDTGVNVCTCTFLYPNGSQESLSLPCDN